VEFPSGARYPLCVVCENQMAARLGGNSRNLCRKSDDIFDVCNETTDNREKHEGCGRYTIKDEIHPAS
jgi:hypothetical protein